MKKKEAKLKMWTEIQRVSSINTNESKKGKKEMAERYKGFKYKRNNKLTTNGNRIL